MLTARTAMLCWDPGTDRVELVPYPDRAWRNHAFQNTTLACNAQTHEMSDSDRRALVFIEAVTLIVRDKCDPQAVHQALLGLEEYQSGIPYDMPGALQP